MKAFLCVILAAVTVVLPGMAQQTRAGADKTDTVPKKTLDESEKKFLKDASIGNMAEVELGKLAQQKAKADQVKQFGQMMVHDHSSAEDQLKSLAASQQVSLPTQLDAKHKNAKASISKLTGQEFDRAYMTLMVQEHTEDVKKFERQASTAHNQSVKQFATTTVPTLKDHLKEAKDLSKKIQGGAIQ